MLDSRAKNIYHKCGNRYHTERRYKMEKYVCTACGYVYDEAAGEPDNGIAPGTKWDALPDDYVCPLCGVAQGYFEKE
jgi:rubredoxin